jgi:hypothetical protein
VLEPYRADIEFRPVAVNGEPGLAVLVQGRLVAIWSIRTDGARILDAYAVLNPDKLRAVTSALATASSVSDPQRKETS